MKKKIKEFIFKYHDKGLFEGCFSLIVLLAIGSYAYINKGKVEGIIDLTIFFSVFVALILNLFTGFISRIVGNKFEDSIKLETDYDKMVKRYSEEKNMVTYINSECNDEAYKIGIKSRLDKDLSERHKFKFPVIQDFSCKNTTFRIIDNKERQYHLPQEIKEHYDELINIHKTSSIFNQLTIRVKNWERIENTIFIYTERSTYYDAMVSNRAMDLKWSNGLSNRDLFAYGPWLGGLENSPFSNHLGFNGFIESSDGEIPFVRRNSIVSIGKRTLANSVGASLKTKYALDDQFNLTIDGLVNGIKKEIQDELKIDPNDYIFSLEDNIISLYRDIVEGGKPQLLFYVKIDITKEQINNTFKKEISRKKSTWNMQEEDGNNLVWVKRDELKELFISPDTIVIQKKKYSIMPTASASIVMLINYLKQEI